MLPVYTLLIAAVLGYFIKRASQKRAHPFATYGPNKFASSIIQLHDPKSIGELFYRRVNYRPSAPAFYEKRNGKWEGTTWAEFFDQASKAASYLVNDLHLSRGSKVCILGPTKPKWVIVDMAVQLSACVSVGVYPHQAVEQYKHVIGHSEADVIFIDGEDELQKVLVAIQDLPNIKSIVVWDDKIVESGKYPPKVKGWSVTQVRQLDEDTLAERIKLEEPGEISVYVYTSGTTGPSKGVMLSHRNIIGLAKGMTSLANFYEDDISYNFLPLAHVAEKIVGFYARIDRGFVNCFATSIAHVLPELREVSPTIFGSVPRIFEKAYAKIFSDVAKKPKWVQVLFKWATEVALERTRRVHIEKKPAGLFLAMKYWLAYKVFSPVRAAFGGRVRQMAVGAAPIDKKLLEFFWGCGVPIFELYGMTELTAVSHVNGSHSMKMGSVGKILRNGENMIAEDGEILVRGPFVFEGYFKNPVATAEVKDMEGWMHTGDIGKLDSDGFLIITDRKKHLIITSGGKNLSPANIEITIKRQDPIISQVHAHGDKRAYITALIAPSPLDTLEWGVETGRIEMDTYKALEKELMANPFLRSNDLNQATAKVTSHPDYIERIRVAVAKGNEHLSQVEKVKKFLVLERDFSQEHGELTPTMKVKRRELEQKYAATFDKLYEMSDFGCNVYSFDKPVD